MLGTRWHSQDVIGRLMQEQPDKYRFITIRALEDDGTCIWSNRYDPQFFIDRKDEVGERVFNAQYQGQPLDETGDFFNLDKVRFITDDELPNYKIISKVRSYDCAYSDDTKGDVNDRTASVLMLRTIDDYYIIRELRADRYGERLFNVIQSTARLDTPSIPVLIETGTVGGSSKALFDIYKDRLQGYRVEQSKPIHSKVDRAYGFKEAILDGKVLICLDDYSRGQLLEEMRGFPLMKHDDIIDACSYAYNYLSSKGGGNMIGTGAKRHRRSLRL